MYMYVSVKLHSTKMKVH